MLFIVFHLVKNLIKNIIAPFRWVTVFIKQKPKVLIEFGTNICIWQPIGKARLGINQLFYFFGESLTLVIDDQLIENIPLPLEKARAICHQAEELGYGLLLILDDSIRVYSKNNLFIRQVGERKEPTEYIIDPDLDYDQISDIYKIYISIPQEEEHLLTLKDTVGHLRFVKDYLMFQYDKKDKGIEQMMEHLQAPLEDVVVFGDDYNDLIMFDPRWTSIAMGNACDALKEKASYVTDANVNDGIEKACRHFGWI